MKIEICANSFESALAAQKGGADRIELCMELAVGGLTPSHGLIEKTVEELDIPVHVLIRPRSGNFTYTPSEIDVMLRDIVFCRETGCAGIVSGVLNQDMSVATAQLQTLIDASGEMSFTFHRAFDWCNDPHTALNELLKFPIARILTSGQEPTAKNGLKLLCHLKDQAGEKLEIMPGSGINSTNIMLFKEKKFTSVHLSASKKRQVLDQKPRISMHSRSFFEEGTVSVSDIQKIYEIVNFSHS